MVLNYAWEEVCDGWEKIKHHLLNNLSLSASDADNLMIQFAYEFPKDFENLYFFPKEFAIAVISEYY